LADALNVTKPTAATALAATALAMIIQNLLLIALSLLFTV
jgi:hypothetical protein